VLALAGACTVPPGGPGATTTTTAAPITPGNPGASDIQFTITSNVNVHPISPLIYGTNSTTNMAGNRPAMVRMGGNRWTAYNWENNASNAGSDYCFQNDDLLSSSTTPGAAVKPTIDQAKAAGAVALVTVPIVDYVAADTNLSNCSDVRNSGPNYLQTRFKQNHSTKPGALSTTPNTSDGNVYQDEFVNWIKTNEPGAAVAFDLDNEPDLWSSTHAEVHPNPVTYQELANRNIDYATAIKRVWPNAAVAGPVNYGFNGFENLQNAPDAGSHGNFLDWWLDTMKSADTTAGHRLVDFMDLHWYPEATGNGVRVTGTDTSAAVVAAREQAPRSLWDPSYVENSWISNPGQYNYGAIKLIPRMQARIAAHYPGTQLSFTEWNYGAGDHISGGIASTDVLGIFGRDKVGMASMWPLNGNDSYTYAAFRAFRNFDGNGGAFGDTSIDATNSDTTNASVYASVDAGNPNRVVIIAVNKATSAKTAGIKIAFPRSLGAAKVYTMTAAGGANMVAQPNVGQVATNAYHYTMPPQSVTVIVPQ
jgi:hypothetical protein